MDSFDSRKRRRTTLISPNLVDLPLTAIADYLPSTNRLLLAISLTAPSFCDVDWADAKLSTASKAVLASKEYWELDFVEISKCAGYKSEYGHESEYYLAHIMSDDGLRGLLWSIDAKMLSNLQNDISLQSILSTSLL